MVRKANASYEVNTNRELAAYPDKGYLLRNFPTLLSLGILVKMDR